VFTTGRRRFRYVPTPHLPHGWDAGVLFEESTKTLLCSDLFHQSGDLEAVTESDVLGRVRETLVAYQSHPVLANYLPYSPLTEQLLGELAALQPQTLATMHGSVYRGDGVTALRDYGKILKEVLGPSFKTAITGS
jgi:flavorubredoxin